MSELVVAPFTIEIADEQLEDLRLRLARARWPDQLAGQEWTYGAELGEVQELVEYWAGSYNWRQAEAELNQLPQFTNSEQVHFLHIRSSHKDATPLLLSHGWPGSIVEFLDLIVPLTEPTSGGRPFHLVIPSLPGFGFSGPTVTEGVSPQRIAGIFVELMAGLGYNKYVAQGGDWGAIITGHIGRADPEHCIGIHLNMVTAAPTPEMLDDASEEELAILTSIGEFQEFETGYQAIQGTKPQTLSFAMADSPVGLCAWIYEKFWRWTDSNGAPFSVIDKDRFLTNLMLYWLTNTAGSASRIYYEFRAAGSELATGVSVPTAGAIFPKEIYKASRRWAEQAFNIVHWTTFEEGGHFAALEQPEALVNDIRSFVDKLES